MTDFQVIPCAPGWFVREPISEMSSDDVIDLSREPIIAWMIDVEREKGRACASAVPITADSGSIADGVVIERPDKSLFIPFDRDFGNESEVVEMYKSRRQRRSRGAA